jgi:hypothetical protein
MLKKVEDSCLQLYAWIQKHGTIGYDPYDVKGYNSFTQKLWVPFSKLNPFQIFSRLVLLDFADTYFPVLTRKIHATVHGLLLTSNCRLYQYYKDEKYLKEAIVHAEWLSKNTIKNKKGMTWGVPFNWRSAESYFTPKTSLSVVGAWCGEGFHLLYEITKEKKYLNICQEICIGFIETIGFNQVNEKELCFNYSDQRKDFILNSNLFTAEMLIRTGILINNQEYIGLANKAVSYVLGNLKEDGSLNYFGKEENNEYPNDVYHSGYEIRMLNRIQQMLPDEKVKKAVDNYLSYFIKNYFDGNSIKLKANKKFPIDATSCAEFISVLSETGHQKEILDQHIQFVFNEMKSKEGYFYYKILKRNIKIKIPYIRWSEAWMLYSLTNYLIHEKQSHHNR